MQRTALFDFSLWLIFRVKILIHFFCVKIFLWSQRNNFSAFLSPIFFSISLSRVRKTAKKLMHAGQVGGIGTR